MHDSLMRVFVATLLTALSTVAHAELVLLPETVTLSETGARHGLLVEQRDGDRLVGDVSASAAFVSDKPDIAYVDDKGFVQAVGDGEAIVTATVNGQSVSAKVVVQGTATPAVVSFRNNVQPILVKMGCNSGGCHGGASGKNGLKLSLRGYDDDFDHKVLTRQANGRRVSLAEPEQSLMLLKPTMQVAHEGGERFLKDSEAYRILLGWIQAGAPPSREDDKRVDRLEVFPKSVTLTMGAEQQLLVQAHYTDNTSEDVTRWVKFGTNDDNVAMVSEQGKVTIKGAGAAAITIFYASKVSSVRLTVPRSSPVAPEVFAKQNTDNYIDRLVIRQLESLQIAPAAVCSDSEFVRRAYIDAIGILPTPSETIAFIMDPAPTKRDQLAATLLNRPEYLDYWSYKWSELLLLSSRNLPKREELTSFYEFIRNSVAENKPWDSFVREIITAKGSTTDNGAANFYVMHKETIDVTETTSQAFMGMSITCARCHNHPLEKWTQDDYYGIANMFSRVKLKNGNREGSFTRVVPDAFGDIIHPRLNKPINPKPLDGEPIALDAPGDRREVLADWLVSPKNTYFTRAIVNRVWKNFMGRGLADPEDDLRLTNPPSNEELLDALAEDLIQHKYDLKHVMRQIMTSTAYQRSSKPSDENNPDDKYYSQYLLRRLSAEVMLDAYSQATGVPTEFPGYPAGYRATQLPDSQVASYFLTSFGRPQRNQTCSCERTDDSSVAQTLHVANGETLNNKLRHEKSFLTELIETRVSDDDAINAIYLRSLSRYPTAAEREQAKNALATGTAEGDNALIERRQALEDLTWAVLSSKEFMFNH